MAGLAVAPLHTEYQSPKLTDQEILVLVQAVFAQAVRDAIKPVVLPGTDPEELKEKARDWLLSDTGEMYADAIDYDPEQVRAWVLSGCPVPEELENSLIRRGRRAK